MWMGPALTFECKNQIYQFLKIYKCTTITEFMLSCKTGEKTHFAVSYQFYDFDKCNNLSKYVYELNLECPIEIMTEYKL